jgi:hypothetical protein
VRAAGSAERGGAERVRGHDGEHARADLADAQLRCPPGHQRCAAEVGPGPADKTDDLLPSWGDPVTLTFTFTKRATVPACPPAHRRSDAELASLLLELYGAQQAHDHQATGHTPGRTARHSSADDHVGEIASTGPPPLSAVSPDLRAVTASGPLGARPRRDPRVSAESAGQRLARHHGLQHLAVLLTHGRMLARLRPSKVRPGPTRGRGAASGPPLAVH